MSQDQKGGDDGALPRPPLEQSTPIESRELSDEELESIAGGDGAWGDEISRLRGLTPDSPDQAASGTA
jgi:hypothetical protein